jgi:alanine-glyoxylate transaminase/serine-glyoxylate transaminase/serine-pyruvate transaminase
MTSTTTYPSAGQLNPTPRLLLGPGPSDLHPRVIAAMTTPVLGHLDPQFLLLMSETQEMLRSVFKTRNELTLPISATGSGGMETCLVNLVEPGDRVLICIAGYFGERMAEIAHRCGAEVHVEQESWGRTFSLDRLRDALRRVRPKVLGIVNAETSTGAWQDLSSLGALCREFDALLLVDCVTSLGCTPVEIDAWQIDAAFSCSQKGLSCPPGLAPLTLGPRAVEAIRRRKSPVRSWYFDLTALQSYWGTERVYHHTAPITMIYALREGLRLVLEEGLEARYERHQRHARALQAGLQALGLRTLTEGHCQLPQLHAVLLPDGVNDVQGRKRLLEEFGIEVGGGLGQYKGRVWRIGLMGYNSRANCVFQILAALEKVLADCGVRCHRGSGVAAAEAVYANSPS